MTTTISAVITAVAGIDRVAPERDIQRNAIDTSNPVARRPPVEIHHGNTPSPTMMCVTKLLLHYRLASGGIFPRDTATGETLTIPPFYG
ncbi:MAG: hypothetical protein NTX54_08815 [Chloroflexi bacterium]|nr:hypothetical protein [Chloroflexota bacterium]